MGNICSKSANKSDPFSQPGRVLGSAPTPSSQPPRAAVPPKVNAARTTPGRTLGGSQAPGPVEGARSAAAQAAEERDRAAKQAAASKKKGKLGSQLAAQQAQSHKEILTEASRMERAAREADEERRRWD
ncbi:hypothetical protein FQN55_005916 [Onygenales sp. PD_40]|nr:hypothetical protein FQN55_005916 [Onygenales sp. PD_40]KAK2787931.1 hypothetical protein FQN53_004372 [Emmonsiellopsis sp. PD_33]KAK2791919.1 hypothetical protein FQN52_004361 [Onygenales sp. PD_12]KAK2801026.1 hypothetical protein FQN51_005590 [Onygenales sp. PD_10]